jgi:hypothetical protein
MWANPRAAPPPKAKPILGGFLGATTLTGLVVSGLVGTGLEAQPASTPRPISMKINVQIDEVLTEFLFLLLRMILVWFIIESSILKG